MNDGMTVRAHGNQVLSRVGLASSLRITQSAQVMNVNESLAKLPVNRAQVASAYETGMSVDLQAGIP